MQSRRAFLAAAGMATVAGCTGVNPLGSGTTPTNETPTLQSASLLLNWKPNGLHVPYYTAAARGYYKDQGLPEMEITAGQGSTFSAKQTGLENVPFAITSSDQVAVVRGQGLPVKTVGVMMQQSPVVVFTTEDVFGGELTDLSQLSGKTVGTGPGMVKVLTKLLLERQGLLDSVTLTNTGYSTVQQLLAGKVDAAGGVFGDAIAAQHQGAETSSIPVAEFIPAYGHVVATSEPFATANPAAVRAFLRATARGTAYAMNNPEAGVEYLLDQNPTLDASRQAVLDGWTRMAAEFLLSQAVTEHGWGWSRTQPWSTVNTALLDAGILDEDVPVQSLYTNEYLDMDYQYVRDFASIVSE